MKERRRTRTRTEKDKKDEKKDKKDKKKDKKDKNDKNDKKDKKKDEKDKKDKKDKKKDKKEDKKKDKKDKKDKKKDKKKAKKKNEKDKKKDKKDGASASHTSRCPVRVTVNYGRDGGASCAADRVPLRRARTGADDIGCGRQCRCVLFWAPSLLAHSLAFLLPLPAFFASLVRRGVARSRGIPALRARGTRGAWT